MNDLIRMLVLFLILPLAMIFLAVWPDCNSILSFSIDFHVFLAEITKTSQLKLTLVWENCWKNLCFTSTIFPWCITTITSAFIIVDKRCAITKVVRFCIAVSNAFWTIASLEASSALKTWIYWYYCVKYSLWSELQT